MKSAGDGASALCAGAAPGKPCAELDQGKLDRLTQARRCGVVAADAPASVVARIRLPKSYRARFVADSMVPLVVPHRARVEAVGNGPLFGGAG